MFLFHPNANPHLPLLWPNVKLKRFAGERVSMCGFVGLDRWRQREKNTERTKEGQKWSRCGLNESNSENGSSEITLFFSCNPDLLAKHDYVWLKHFLHIPLDKLPTKLREYTHRLCSAHTSCTWMHLHTYMNATQAQSQMYPVECANVLTRTRCNLKQTFSHGA